jgi:hypothetical protein
MKQRSREAMRNIKIAGPEGLWVFESPSRASFFVMFRAKRGIRFSQIPLRYT